jgi:hypothetical protein
VVVPDARPRIAANAPEHARSRDASAPLQFIKETVPAVVEAQSGAVTRKLQAAHEGFDIECAKIQKREQKIMKRFEAHVRAAAQSIEDEKVRQCCASAAT